MRSESCALVSKKNRILLAILATAAAGLMAGQTASAAVIAFDDAYQNSCDGFGGPVVVDSPAPRYAGDKALQCDPAGAWGQIGVSLSNMVIPADATQMQFDVYLTSTVTGFPYGIVQLGAPTWHEQRFGSDQNATHWTIDGKSLSEGGSISSLSPNTWHTLIMDLPGGFGADVTPGTSTLLHVVAMNSQTGTYYMDNVQLTGAAVPEPASLGVLALGSLAMLRRHRAR